MAGIFGQLQPFKEGETRQEYVEIFENKFMANDIDNDKKKRRKEKKKNVHSVCKCWVSDLLHYQTKTFAAVCDLVRNHFKPKLYEASSSIGAVRRRKVFKCSWQS